MKIINLSHNRFTYAVWLTSTKLSKLPDGIHYECIFRAEVSALNAQAAALSKIERDIFIDELLFGTSSQ